MAFLTLIVLVFAVLVLGLSVVFSLIYAKKSRIAAAITALLILPFAGFFVFGFLASFEPMEGTTATWAKIIYGILFTGSFCVFLWSVFCLVRPGSRGGDEPTT